ncbi:MAG: hypothetical protein ACK484_08830 [Sphingobacteriales bacterium]|jgi:hypothetical protein
MQVLIFFILIIFSPITALSQKKATDQKSRASLPYHQTDTVYWVVNFEQFRDAIYQRNKAKAKAFFDFPMDTADGELWYLALGGFSNATDVAATSKYFTAKDLDRYFDHVFPSDLVKGFLKVKIKELYNTGHSESPEWKKDQKTYQLRARYDRESSEIELNLSIHSAVEVSENEFDPIESNLIYKFSIRPNGHIKFLNCFLAG